MASSSDTAVSGLRPAASDSEPERNSVAMTPNRYMSMVAEISASVSPMLPLYSEYKGMGTAEAANTMMKANVAINKPRNPPRDRAPSTASTVSTSMAPPHRSKRNPPASLDAKSDCAQHSTA